MAFQASLPKCGTKAISAKNCLKTTKIIGHTLLLAMNIASLKFRALTFYLIV